MAVRRRTDDRTTLDIKTEQELAELIAQFYDDPYGFVMAAYPWGLDFTFDGEPNPLKDKTGPDKWQKELLIRIGERIKRNIHFEANGLDMEVQRYARASGHGVGKSAVVAWLVQFFMSTRRDTRGWVTASTQKQLEDKTWPELAKWHKLLINKSWFVWTATTYYFAKYDDEQRKNYMVTAMTVGEDNTEAFAGGHNEGKTIFYIMDEASGVVDAVHNVMGGGTTDGEVFIFKFGNPTRAEGEFYECFNKYKDKYDCAHIDSREVRHTNKKALQDIIDMYGEDSDEVAIRVKGIFPKQSYNGFIPMELVIIAQQRDMVFDPGAALIMALDAARFGRDTAVIAFRQGRDARSRPSQSYTGLNTVALAEICMREADVHKPDAIVIESVGPGVAVIDIMRSRGYRVIEIHPGAPSSRPREFLNVRMELWYLGREAIGTELCLPEDPELVTQLTKIQYSYVKGEAVMQLESKADYKVRTGEPSPDKADAYMLTYAVRVPRRDAAHSARHTAGPGGTDRNAAITDYDIFAH